MTTESLAEELASLLAQRTRRAQEREIISLLSRVTAEQLGPLLLATDLGRLFSAMDDRRFGPDLRTELVRVLTIERVAELPLQVRAAIIRCFQAGRTSAVDERGAADLLCATRGAELTALKNLLDTTDTHRDLHQLVYSDIDSSVIREEVLGHLKEHSPRPEHPELKVLSDIDDTFYANWKDTRYPKKTVYPGVCTFYEELDRGPHDKAGRLGDVVFVTARPKDRPGFVERKTHKSLRERGVADPAVLAGSLFTLRSHSAMAEKKFENFTQYAKLFPEYDFAFVGDSGQGDAQFGQQILEAERERVRAVFIHDVVDTSDAKRADWRNKGVDFFDTYVGAAVLARSRELVHKAAPARVWESARAELEKIVFADEHLARSRTAEHHRDAKEA